MKRSGQVHPTLVPNIPPPPTFTPGMVMCNYVRTYICTVIDYTTKLAHKLTSIAPYFTLYLYCTTYVYLLGPLGPTTVYTS